MAEKLTEKETDYALEEYKILWNYYKKILEQRDGESLHRTRIYPEVFIIQKIHIIAERFGFYIFSLTYG